MPLRRILSIALVSLGLGLGSGVDAQQQIASAAAQGRAIGVRTPARAGARTQVFTTTIQGNALNSTNGQLANTIVRLRDARFGRVIDTQLTDTSGLFAFRTVDPGSYIVEIMSADQNSILAASQLLNVNAGDVASAVVKLPFRLPPFAGILGGNAASATPATATAVVTEAAANSILAVTPAAAAADTCAQLLP